MQILKQNYASKFILDQRGPIPLGVKLDFGLSPFHFKIDLC